MRISDCSADVCSSYLAWLNPLFPDLAERDARLIKALCMLSDIAWSEHPSYRGEHAFLRVLRLPMAGLDHADRVFLAFGILVRYVGHTDLAAARAVEGLLEPGRRVDRHSVREGKRGSVRVDIGVR